MKRPKEEKLMKGHKNWTLTEDGTIERVGDIALGAGRKYQSIEKSAKKKARKKTIHLRECHGVLGGGQTKRKRQHLCSK